MITRSRRRIFWTAGVLVALNLGGYLAYTVPRSMQKRNVASRLEELRGELAQERGRVADLKARAHAIEANRKEALQFFQARVEGPGTSLVPILEEVESLARRQGLNVGTQGFAREGVKGLPLDKFAITMQVTGTYDQVAGLVQHLERSRHFLTLDEIGARRQGSDGEGGVVLNLLLSAYFRANPGAPSR